MSFTLTLPKEYPLVLLAAVGTCWVTQYQTIVVSRKRKAAGIEYPQMYAEKAEATASFAAKQFNCAQRAHQNTLETLPQLLFSLLLSGLKYPRLTAGLGGAWIVGRVLYTIGYSSGIPKKRGRGAFALAANAVLLLTSTWTAVELVRSHFCDF